MNGAEEQPKAEKRQPPVIKIALEAVLSDGSTSRFDVEQVRRYAVQLCPALLAFPCSHRVVHRQLQDLVLHGALLFALVTCLARQLV